ncbi:MAG: hypothetical protein ACPL7I_04805, partial [Myxococcota bacterium]
MFRLTNRYLLYTILFLIFWIIWNIYWINNNYEYSGFDILGHLSNEKDVLAQISSELRYSSFTAGIKTITQLSREGL